MPTLMPGAHLITSRLGQPHHGLYLGHEGVIHYPAPSAGHTFSQPTIHSLEAFSQGHPLQLQAHPHRLFSREESVGRAYAHLGELDTRQPFGNDEQFVTWCIDGTPHTSSTSNLLKTTVATLVAAEVARHTLGKVATTTAAGIAATTLTSTATGTATTAALTSVASVVSAPVLVPLAVGAAAVYGASKLWDWLTD